MEELVNSTRDTKEKSFEIKNKQIMPPKVSVIIPVYNVEKYLREAVDSILNQTLTDLEIILIDDGGKDNCPKIIDEYAAKDSRIVAIHKENGGYGQSMNVGLERAKGEYIAILEPDDYIDANMYRDLYNIAKQFDSDIVKSCFYINLQTKGATQITRSGWLDYIPEDRSFTIQEYHQFLLYHPSVWSCIYKREFLNINKIRFVEAPGAGWTDNPFQVQTMCLARRINYTSKSYYYWRILNKNPSEELKDWTLPFKRSDEIHEWLEEKGFNNESILAALYGREMCYIDIALNKNELKDHKTFIKSLYKMVKRMEPSTLLKSKYITSRQKRLYKQILLCPMFVYIISRVKIFIKSLKKKKKSIIKFKLSLKESYFIVFGKTIFNRNSFKGN